MPSEPVPAEPEWDEDPAWLDRDPMTAAERETWLDRAGAQDDDPSDAAEEYRDLSPARRRLQDELTGQELAEIREAAADEMLAVEAASHRAARPGPARLGAGVPGRVGGPGGRVRRRGWPST